MLAVLEKMIKQRKEGSRIFRPAAAPIWWRRRAPKSDPRSVLPARLSDAELDALIAAAITSTGASSPKDMGKVIALVKSQAQGRADMGVVSGRVKEKLSPP